MRQIDVNRLSGMVTPTAVRANKVRRDPAVVKAAKQAVTDTRQARDSVGTFAKEVAESWIRHGDNSTNADKPNVTVVQV